METKISGGISFKNLFVICLILFSEISFSQIYEKPIYEIERDARAKNFESINADYKSDTNINVIYYKLHLNITYKPNFLIGDVNIKCKSLVNSLQVIFYDLSNNLIVDSVLSEKNNLPFSHSQNKIFIILINSVNQGQEISVNIFYHGTPVPTGYGSFVFGSHNGSEPAIWTLSEPFGSIDWFPCKNVPADKCDSSDVWLRCDDKLTAVSNGVLKELENHEDGTVTFKWHNSYPIVHYVISLAISNYAQYNSYFKYSANDSMPVYNYIYPENLNNLKTQLDKTNQMLELFSQKFGLYPFIKEKYGHVEFGRIAGMEHQTISSMGVFNDNIMAHELTHQWFGDKITCKNWENIWLNEGFATFGEAIYNESVHGRTGYNEFIKFRMSDARNAVGSIYVQDVNSINEIFNGNRSYAKGCVVLHMLRGVVGDSPFFRILRTYSSDTSIAYKTAVTDDFQEIAERVHGLDLDYFFQQWIYGENYPKYNVSWVVESINSSQYRTSINIFQDINTDPSYFAMPLPIKIVTQRGDTTFIVFNNLQNQTFDFILNSKPVNFKIDPDNWVLKTVRGEDIIPVNFILEQNYPNPFNPSTNISYQLGKPSFIRIKVYDVLGQEIAVLKNENQREGNYTVEFNASFSEGKSLSSGIYFYKLEAHDSDDNNLLFSQTKKMILIK